MIYKMVTKKLNLKYMYIIYFGNKRFMLKLNLFLSDPFLHPPGQRSTHH